jgi:hypothetical protein
VHAGFPEALANAAGIAMEMESLEEARALYIRSAQLRPGFADAEYGLAQVALREHRFAEGWDGYERRFDTHPPLATPRALPQPRLDPDALARAKRVALWSEQGLGDQILFTTLLPELERRGIRAVVEVDARLLGLYRRALPFFEFTPREEAARAFGRLRLPAAPGLACAPLPPQRRKLRGAADGASRRRRRPRPDNGARGQAPAGAHAPLIAISWRSLQTGARRALGERKSVPLEDFAELARATGARLLDLQYGDVDAERRAFDERHPGVRVRADGARCEKRPRGRGRRARALRPAGHGEQRDRAPRGRARRADAARGPARLGAVSLLGSRPRRPFALVSVGHGVADDTRRRGRASLALALLQRAPLDLAGGRLGQRLLEGDDGRYLVRRHLAARPSDDVLGAHLARASAASAPRRPSPSRRGARPSRDHAGFLHVGMPVERRLDFGGPDPSCRRR